MVGKMQKYNLWINQSCIILLGIAIILIATEYQNIVFWQTDNSIIETDTYSEVDANLK